MEINVKRLRTKRYGWLRLFNDFPGHAKWRLIARRAQLSLAEVEAVAIRIMVRANKGKPRGNIEDFSCEEVAADLDLDVCQVVKVYQDLEESGWIDREYLVTWDERQPDKEDLTAAARQARRRAKLRKERGEIDEQSHAVTSRQVTPKTQTQKDKKEAPVTKLSTGQTVTWKDVQESGYVPPKQRSLPLPPVPLRKKGA